MYRKRMVSVKIDVEFGMDAYVFIKVRTFKINVRYRWCEDPKKVQKQLDRLVRIFTNSAN